MECLMTTLSRSTWTSLTTNRTTFWRSSTDSVCARSRRAQRNLSTFAATRRYASRDQRAGLRAPQAERRLRALVCVAPACGCAVPQARSAPPGTPRSSGPSPFGIESPLAQAAPSASGWGWRSAAVPDAGPTPGEPSSDPPAVLPRHPRPIDRDSPGEPACLNIAAGPPIGHDPCPCSGSTGSCPLRSWPRCDRMHSRSADRPVFPAGSTLPSYADGPGVCCAPTAQRPWRRSSHPRSQERQSRSTPAEAALHAPSGG